MPFEAPLLTEPVFTPPLIGCTAENIENFVDTEQGNSGFLLFTLFISILRCFFVQPSQAFIYRAKSYYCCRMLTHFLLKLSSFFFFLPRKPSETFMSRALCTELWRQISVTLLLYYFDLANIEQLMCRRDNSAGCLCRSVLHSSSFTPLFFFHRTVYLLW